MPSTYLRYTISALLMVCLCPYLYAQSATLEGSVSDASGELMPGITVILDNDQGVATDVSGNFILRNISPGKHTLAISGVGYAAKTQAVSLKEGQTLRLSIQLEEGLLEMDEVIVQGKSEAQVKMEQPIKVEAMDISRIQERSTPVPQLINQMPGVNIRQSAGVGSTVTVNLNGLQGNAIRYFRDGIPLDYLGKAFDISIVPIGQLGGVEVYKGILPASLGADALGGAINLISNNLYESQLDVSYGFGSFNTHQANVNGFFQIPGTKLYTKLSSYYVSAENNYEMEVQVVDEESQTLKPANVTRFHDGVESKFVEVAAGVTDIRYADLFEIGYAYFDYEKEEQHGFNVSKPFGEVMNYENFDAFHTRYKKALGKLEIDLFGAYSMKNTLFADTSGNRYDWNGDVVAVVSGTEGEANTKSFRSLDFENFVGRFNLTYQLGKAAITLNHNITTDRRVGNDPFGQRIGIDGETIDPFSIPASYDKNISGLQVTFPLWKERITQVVTAKRYAITTSSLSQWGIGDLTPTFSDESYGVGTSLKFSFSPDRFIRLSYENATRIPESREYFGDGAFLIGNPLLNPEQSHNINLGLYTNLDQNKDWWLDVNAFYRHVQDQIILQPLWLIFSQYQNKDEAKIQGVEASVRTTLFDKLKISANITYQDARRFNIETRSEQVMEGARLPFRPFFYTNLNFNYDLHGLFGSSNRLSLYSNYSFVEKYIFIQIPQSQEPGIFENVEGSQLSNLEDFLIPTQHMVNAGASYKFNDLPLWLNLEVNNALNLELYDNFRIPKQPINYNIKIRYQLK